MKVRIALTIEVDSAGWIRDYGDMGVDIRDDVKAYVQEIILQGSDNFSLPQKLETSGSSQAPTVEGLTPDQTFGKRFGLVRIIGIDTGLKGLTGVVETYPTVNDCRATIILNQGQPRAGERVWVHPTNYTYI